MALNKREWKPKEEIAKMLDEKYPQLGDLTKDEFTALKYLIQQDKSFLIIDNIDLKTIQIKDGEDKWRDATVDDIEPHDDIRANIILRLSLYLLGAEKSALVLLVRVPLDCS